MTSDSKAKDGISNIEKLYPLCSSIFVFCLGAFTLNTIDIRYSTSFDNVLSSAVTFVSIMVGFAGVLLGILFSMNASHSIVKKLFIYSEKFVLKGYFMSTILSGVVLVLLSTFLFLRDNIKTLLNFNVMNLDAYNILVVLWTSLITYFLLSNWRIVHIIMHIIFSDDIDESDIESIEMEKEDALALQAKYKK